MLDEKTRALLGDREAQEAITARGELLPCPCCGAQPTQFGGPSISYVHCDKCGMEAYRMVSDGEDVVEKICAHSPEREARLVWNTRAPVLTPTQIALLGIAREPRKFEEGIK